MNKKRFYPGYGLLFQQAIWWAALSFSGVSFSVITSSIPGINVSVVLMWQSAGVILSAPLFIFCGYYIKKHGVRFIQSISGMLLGATFILIPLFSNSHLIGLMIALQQLLVATYCSGTSPPLIIKWFPKNKGIAMGFVTSFTVLSTILMLPIFNSLILSRGIVVAMRYFGIFFILWGTLGLVVIRESPQQAGFYPENMSESEYKDYTEKFTHDNLGKADTSPWTLYQIIRSPKVWAFAVGWGLCMCSMVGVGITAVGSLSEKGLAIPLVMKVMTFPGLSHIGCYAAMWIGTSGPTISPFSTGGALTLMSCPEEYKEKQTKQQIYVAGLVLIIGFIVTLSGYCNLIRP